TFCAAGPLGRKERGARVMEAIVNAAYDRISEDIILLFDAIASWDACDPQPPPIALLHAIRHVLREEDINRGRGSWRKSSDMLHELLGEEAAEAQEALANKAKEYSRWGTYPMSAEEAAHVVRGDTQNEPALLELARILATSILSDIAVLPFWTVKISEVAHRGRLPELYPFQSYRLAIQALVSKEGWSGPFKGVVPVCAGGLLRYFRRNRQLYSDYYWRTSNRIAARLVMPGNDDAARER
ncbi:unnamed protein product, partial [Chrysoparadoxa australica]